MSAPGSPPQTAIENLGIQAGVYQLFFDQYTGAGGSAAPIYSTAKAYNALGWVSSDGVNGYISWTLWENNVAASGAIIIEGTDVAGASTDSTPANTQPGTPYSGSAMSGALWVPVGYYTIVANGVTQTTLTRAQGAVTLTRNTVTKLQILDAYPYLRARVTSNASSASLSALMFGMAN